MHARTLYFISQHSRCMLATPCFYCARPSAAAGWMRHIKRLLRMAGPPYKLHYPMEHSQPSRCPLLYTLLLLQLGKRPGCAEQRPASRNRLQLEGPITDCNSRSTNSSRPPPQPPPQTTLPLKTERRSERRNAKTVCSIRLRLSYPIRLLGIE